jgi:hypothetical protein
MDADKITDLILLSLNLSKDNQKKQIISHLIKTEFMKYEQVLNDVGETLTYEQADHTWVNELVKKINTVLYYFPKKNEL